MCAPIINPGRKQWPIILELPSPHLFLSSLFHPPWWPQPPPPPRLFGSLQLKTRLHFAKRAPSSALHSLQHFFVSIKPPAGDTNRFAGRAHLQQPAQQKVHPFVWKCLVCVRLVHLEDHLAPRGCCVTQFVMLCFTIGIRLVLLADSKWVAHRPVWCVQEIRLERGRERCKVAVITSKDTSYRTLKACFFFFMFLVSATVRIQWRGCGTLVRTSCCYCFNATCLITDKTDFAEFFYKFALAAD